MAAVIMNFGFEFDRGIDRENRESGHFHHSGMGHGDIISSILSAIISTWSSRTCAQKHKKRESFGVFRVFMSHVS
jgi:hypothetical protein